MQLDKLAFALSGSRATDVRAARAGDEDRWLRLLSLDARWLCLLALVGLGPFLLLARGGRRLAVAWAVLLLSVVAFYVSERYLVVLLPYQAIFAGSLAAVPRAASRRAVLVAALAGTLGGAALFRCELVVDNERLSERLDAVTDRWIAMGDRRRAHDLAGLLAQMPDALADFPAGQWAAAFRMLPFEDKAVLDRAAQLSEERWGSAIPLDRIFLEQLRFAAGECEEVERLASTLPVPVYLPSYYDALMDPFADAARCAMRRRDWRAASGWISRSLENKPGNREALALAYAVARATDDAAELSRRQAELYRLHDQFSAEWALARSLRGAGLLPEAEKAIDRSLLMLRGGFMLRFERARILGDEARWRECARDLNRAVELVPDYNYPLGDGIGRQGREAPYDRALALSRVYTLAFQARFREALDLAREWQARDPADDFSLSLSLLAPWDAR